MEDSVDELLKPIKQLNDGFEDENNYFNCFLFTNNRGCDLIKKKTGIIKPEGEIVKERLFITPEYTTAKEIKKIRKELHLTQKEFAEFINCSKPTVERWERSEDVIRGPIVPFLKMLQKYPEYEQEVKVPEKVWPLRIWYMYDQDVCTLIDVNERERKVKIKIIQIRLCSVHLGLWKNRIIISI